MHTGKQHPRNVVRARITPSFNEKYYRLRYGTKSDFRDALEHFLTKGWQLGYDPAPDFSTSYYLANNPDVADSGLNPFGHYLIYGQQEGRLPIEDKLHGYVDEINSEIVRGWAWLPLTPNIRPELELLVNDTICARTRADQLRPDLAELQIEDGRYGFAFATPRVMLDGCGHSITIRRCEDHQVLYQSPEPIRPGTPNGEIVKADLNCVSVIAWLSEQSVEPPRVSLRFGDLVIAEGRPDQAQHFELAIPQSIYADFAGDRNFTFDLMVGDLIVDSVTISGIEQVGPVLVALETCTSETIVGSLRATEVQQQPVIVLFKIDGETICSQTLEAGSGEFYLQPDISELTTDDHEIVLAFEQEGQSLGQLPCPMQDLVMQVEGLLYEKRTLSGRVVGVAEGRSTPQLELLIDGQPTTTLKLQETPGLEVGWEFRLSLSMHWCDDRVHEVQIRELGSGRLLLNAPRRFLFGPYYRPILHNISRTAEGSLIGWILSAASPEQPPELKVIDSAEEVLWQGVPESNRLQHDSERLPAVWGIEIALPDHTHSSLQVEISDCDHHELVTLEPLLECEGLVIASPHEIEGGTCVLVPALVMPSVHEIEEIRATLLLTANQIEDLPKPVTLAIFDKGPVSLDDLSRLIGSYNAEKLRDARLIAIPEPVVPLTDQDSCLYAYSFNLWAQNQRFCHIIAPAANGLLTYALNARAQGLSYHKTHFTTVVEDLAIIRRTDNLQLLDSLLKFFDDVLERQTLRRADLIACPNEFIRKRLIQGEYAHEGELQILPCALPSIGSEDHHTPVSTPEHSTIIYCAPLSPAYGIITFCDSIDRLAVQLDGHQQLPRIIIAGSRNHIFDSDSITYIRRRTRRWPFQVDLYADLPTDELLELLHHSVQTQAVYISFARGQGTYHDQLCQAAGIGRLLVSPDNIETNCENAQMVTNNPSRIARHLVDWLGGHRTLEPAIAAKNVSLPPISPPKAPKISSGNKEPLVSLCVSHYNRPYLLRQTLASIAANDYANKQIVVVDDGSDIPGIETELEDIEAWLQDNNGRLVRQENSYLGTTRNKAVSETDGEFILFMDDDNIAMPDMIQHFVKAQQHTKADLLTSFFAFFDGNALIQPGRSIPGKICNVPGGSKGISALVNTFGDANMLIRRTTFEEIGGFTQDYGRGHEDWELFTRAALHEYRIETIPHPLFWYRVDDDGMLRRRESAHADYLRNIRAYRDVLPAELYNVLLLAQGMVAADQNW